MCFYLMKESELHLTPQMNEPELTAQKSMFLTTFSFKINTAYDSATHLLRPESKSTVHHHKFNKILLKMLNVKLQYTSKAHPK